jgi:hypothetical protein
MSSSLPPPKKKGKKICVDIYLEQLGVQFY